jgi:hypothetical protein
MTWQCTVNNIHAFALNYNVILNSLCLFPFSIMCRNTRIWQSHSALLFTFIFVSFLFFHSLHFPLFQKYFLCASLNQIYSIPFFYPLMLPFSCLKSMQLILCPFEFLFPSLKFPLSNFLNIVHPHILQLFFFVPLGVLLLHCLYSVKYFKSLIWKNKEIRKLWHFIV